VPLSRETDDLMVNIDRLTYASNLDSLRPIAGNPRYRFVRGDISA
jgi:dTDP-glucose 4,6-dehydratase